MSLDLMAYYGLTVDDAEEPKEEKVELDEQTSDQTQDLGPAPVAQSPRGPVSDGNPFNIDGKDFDSKAFLDRELRRKGVKELVELNHEISTAKRSLDNEIKLLVYENYSKFIKATDMIKDMKENVESMESDMLMVERQMESIRTNALNLEQSFAPNRSKVDNLVGVSRLLNRLEFLFELPGRLRRCIAVGADAQAVRYFRTASRILQRYKNVKSFERIRSESESIANGLRQSLRARVKDTANLSAADQIEVASMLIDLQEPEDQLLADIFAARRERLLNEIETARKRLAAEPGIAPDRAIGILHIGFNESLILFASSFMEGFVRSRNGAQERSASPQSPSAQKPGSIASRCYTALVEFVEEMLEPFFQEAEACLVKRAAVQFPLGLSTVSGLASSPSSASSPASAASVSSSSVSSASASASASSSSSASPGPSTQDPKENPPPSSAAPPEQDSAEAEDERKLPEDAEDPKPAKASPLSELLDSEAPPKPEQSEFSGSERIEQAVRLLISATQGFQESMRSLLGVLSEGDQASKLRIQKLRARASELAVRALQRGALQVFLHCEENQARVVLRLCSKLESPGAVSEKLFAVAAKGLELVAPLSKVIREELRSEDPTSVFVSRMLQSWGNVLLFHCDPQGHRQHRGSSAVHRCAFLRPSQAPVFQCARSESELPPAPEDAFGESEGAEPQAMELLPKLAHTAPPAVFLTLSRVASELARQRIDQFLGLLSSQDIPVSPALLKTRVPALIALASEASQLLLRGWVERQARLRSLGPIWAGLRTQLASPSNASEVVLGFWAALQKDLLPELARLLPGAPNYRPAVSFRGGASSGLGSFGGRLESDIGKLFRQRVAIFDEVPATRQAALQALLKALFKELLEVARRQRLDEWAVFQLQIDLLLCRQFLQHLLSEADAEPLAQLLDETLSSAVARAGSLSPQTLARQSGIAETVCSKYMNLLPVSQ